MDSYNDDYDNYTEESPFEIKIARIIDEKNKALAMYSAGFPWELVFMKFADRLANAWQYAPGSDIWYEFQGYLQAFKYVESTIPNYSYYTDKKIDDHSRWMYRIFHLLGRAYVSEIETIESDYGKQHNFEFRKNPTNPNELFHCGPGNSKADLYSPAEKEYYDVKFVVDFDKIHEGHYIIKYQPSGYCMIYDKNLVKKDENGNIINKGYTGICFQAKDIYEAFADRGIPSFVLDTTDEKKLEEMFDFCDFQ